MRTLTAKYRGICLSCRQAINPGDRINFLGKGRAFHEACPAQGSHYTRFSSGAEVYTNRRGRCEDAPCCGCCS